MTDRASTDLGALADLRLAFNRFAPECETAVLRVTRQIEAVQRQVADELGKRRREESQTAAALAACQQSPEGNCSAAAERLRRAQLRVRAAERAASATSQAAARFEPARQRFVRAIHTASGQAHGNLIRHDGRLRSYLAGTALAGSSGLGDGAAAGQTSGSGSGTELVQPAGAPDGFVLVPLGLIDTSGGTHVTGPESFTKGYSVADLSWSFDALDEVVLPGLAAGRDLDYFRARDQAEGRMGTRSYSDTYSGWLGGDAVRVSRQADGSFAVQNGYHRIWVARQAGRGDVLAQLVP